jgi:hypothetical protein
MPAPRDRPIAGDPRSLLLPDSPARAAGPPPTDPSALNARTRRELILLLVLLACGLFGVPLLIWLVGQFVLGPYADGGAFALLADFFAGLRTGSLIHWSVVVGPYLFVLILRLFWHFIRQSERFS